jgi:hypothetical protein
MTTIAVSASQIAADGQRIWGDLIAGRQFKKIRVCHGAIYAFTGLVPMHEPMIAWHAAGADPAKLPHGASDDKHGGWTLIVVDREGVGKYTNSCPYLERLDTPVAFGAGQDYAMGAMWHGASAGEAVRLVAAHTNHTGGVIQVVDIAEALGLDKAREAAE